VNGRTAPRRSRSGQNRAPPGGKRSSKRITPRDAVVLSSRFRKLGNLETAAETLRPFNPPQSPSTAILNEYLHLRVAESRALETSSLACLGDEVVQSVALNPPSPSVSPLPVYLSLLDVVRNSPAVVNSRTYNALLSALRTGDTSFASTALERGIALLEEDMCEHGVAPDPFTLSILFQMCGAAGDVNAALALRDASTELLEIVSSTALIAALAKCGDVYHAEQEFAAVIARGLQVNERTYTAIISAFYRAGLHTKVLGSMNDALASPHVRLNLYVFTAALSSCAKTGDAANARRFFSCMLDAGIRPNVDAVNSVLDAAVRGGDVTLAMVVLYEWLPKCRMAVHLSQIVKVISLCGRVDAAGGGGKQPILRLLRTMRSMLGALPDISTYNAAVSALGRMKDLDAARHLFDVEIPGAGLVANISTFNALISAYGVAGDVGESCALLDKLSASDSPVKPNQITYNCVLEQCVRANDVELVSDVIRQMNTAPDVSLESVSITSLMQLYRIRRNPEAALALVRAFARDNVVAPISIDLVRETAGSRAKKLDTTVYNSLITVCFENGKTAEAVGIAGMLFVTRRMNAGTYNVLITHVGLRLKNPIRASSMLADMKRRGIAPDDVTYSTLIRSCAQTGTLQLAYRLLGEMQDIGLGGKDTYAWTSLIDGFGRAGQWQRAVELLECMRQGKGLLEGADEGQRTSHTLSRGLIPQPSTASYNAALYAAGMGGGGWKVSQRIFQSLCADPNVAPDHISYSAMASAILANRSRVSNLCFVKDITDKLREARNMVEMEHAVLPSEYLSNVLKKITSKIRRLEWFVATATEALGSIDGGSNVHDDAGGGQPSS
jgi:pentatricopeptide repeat protein